MLFNKSKQLLVLSALLFSFSVNADQTAPSLDKLYPGYDATVLNSYDDLKKIFDEMPLGFKMGGWGGLGKTSQCYQRAELWSYHFYRNDHLNGMKVFLFFTNTYKRAYYSMHGHTFDWWFHVAPYLLFKNEKTNSIEESVVDATFFNSPANMKTWTDRFIDTHVQCAEFVPFSKFHAEVENGPDATYGKEHCYIIRVPATDYDPTDIEEREKGQKNGYIWGRDELEQAVNYAPTSGMRGWWRNLLGL